MKIKTIDVNAKEWFDKVNGNSYFSGTITLNYGMKTQKELAMPFQYGYGDHFLDVACDLLDNANFIKNDSYTRLPRYCRENDIILRYNKQENCKKRDL
jgi:hypothetical protein